MASNSEGQLSERCLSGRHRTGTEDISTDRERDGGKYGADSPNPFPVSERLETDDETQTMNPGQLQDSSPDPKSVAQAKAKDVELSVGTKRDYKSDGPNNGETDPSIGKDVNDDDDDDEHNDDDHDDGDNDTGPDNYKVAGEDFVAHPPDGGWGWTVVFGSALAFFLGGGVSRSFTLIYEQLLEVFHDTASSTSATAAIFGAVKMCTSPLVSLLCSKFSKRTVTVCGGLITATAMLMTSFPISLPYLYFTYGILAAFGFNMVLTPCFVIVGEYFRKRRARAMSLAMLGGSLGGVSLPPLLSFLFQRYDYSGTMLIVSGLVLNLCVAGSLFRSLARDTPAEKRKDRRRRKRNSAEVDADKKSSSEASTRERRDYIARNDANPAIQVPNIVIQDDGDLKSASSSLLEGHEDNLLKSRLDRLAEDRTKDAHEGLKGIIFEDYKNNLLEGRKESLTEGSKGIRKDGLLEGCRGSLLEGRKNSLLEDRKDSLLEGRKDSDCLTIPPRRTSRQVSFQIEGAIHLPDSVPSEAVSGRSRHKRMLRRYYAVLKSVGIPLFSQPRFVAFSLLMLGSVLSLSVSGVFLSGLVAELGLRRARTGLLLSSAAAVDIPSKFVSGFVFDLRQVRPYRSSLLAALGFLTGVFSLLMAFSTGFVDLFAVYMLYTFFASAYHTQHATVLADLVGSANLSAAMGLCRLSQGIGFILGPTLGGHIRDITGKYLYAYVFSGSILLAFTLFYTSAEVWLLWKRKREQESELELSELSDGHVARYRHDSISTIT